MILYINTSLIDSLEVSLKKDDKLIFKKQLKAQKKQAEKLLPSIDKLLKTSNVKLKDIKEIRVYNQGGTFTGLRIGVLTANALAYSLQIPVNSANNLKKKSKNLPPKQIVEAIYDKEVSIGKKKTACV